MAKCRGSHTDLQGVYCSRKTTASCVTLAIPILSTGRSCLVPTADLTSTSTDTFDPCTDLRSIAFSRQYLVRVNISESTSAAGKCRRHQVVEMFALIVGKSRCYLFQGMTSQPSLAHSALGIIFVVIKFCCCHYHQPARNAVCPHASVRYAVTSGNVRRVTGQTGGWGYACCRAHATRQADVWSPPQSDDTDVFVSGCFLLIPSSPSDGCAYLDLLNGGGHDVECYYCVALWAGN